MSRMGRPIGIGDAEAMIVHTQRNGQLKGPAEGMAGTTAEVLGDAASGVLDGVTGGLITDVRAQLTELRTYLQISIACSIVAGGLALVQFIDNRRRA